MKMNEKTLKFRDVEFNKKEFDASEQTVTLDLVNMSNLNSDKDSKYFIGYTDNIIRSLCIVLGQMSK